MRRTPNHRIAAVLGSKECMLEEQLAEGAMVRMSGALRERGDGQCAVSPFSHGSSTGRGFEVGAALGYGKVAICTPAGR